MTHVAKIVELVGNSSKSWEDAARAAVEKASETIHNIRGIDVVSQTAKIENGKIVEYRTCVKVAFGVD